MFFRLVFNDLTSFRTYFVLEIIIDFKFNIIILQVPVSCDTFRARTSVFTYHIYHNIKKYLPTRFVWKII